MWPQVVPKRVVSVFDVRSKTLSSGSSSGHVFRPRLSAAPSGQAFGPRLPNGLWVFTRGKSFSGFFPDGCEAPVSDAAEIHSKTSALGLATLSGVLGSWVGAQRPRERGRSFSGFVSRWLRGTRVRRCRDPQQNVSTRPYHVNLQLTRLTCLTPLIFVGTSALGLPAFCFR